MVEMRDAQISQCANVGLRGDGRRTGSRLGRGGQRGGPWPCHVTGSGGGRGHVGRTVSPMLRRSLQPKSVTGERLGALEERRGSVRYGLSFCETRENACLFPAAEPERGGQSADADIWRCAMRSRCSQSESHSSYLSKSMTKIFSDSAFSHVSDTCGVSARLSPAARPWGRIGDCDWALPRPCVHPHLHTHTSPSPRHLTGSS